jgi:hypothetical protein
MNHRRALSKSFVVLWTAENNAHQQQQQNTHTPFIMGFAHLYEAGFLHYVWGKGKERKERGGWGKGG